MIYYTCTSLRMGLTTSSGISISGELKDRMWVRRMTPQPVGIAYLCISTRRGADDISSSAARGVSWEEEAVTVLEIESCKRGGSGCCWLYNDKVPFLMTIWIFFLSFVFFSLFTSFPHFPQYKWVYTRRRTFLPRHISGFCRTNLFVKCKFSTSEINDNITTFSLKPHSAAAVGCFLQPCSLNVTPSHSP